MASLRLGTRVVVADRPETMREEPVDDRSVSINERGVVEFRVTGNNGNTTLARIVRAVQNA